MSNSMWDRIVSRKHPGAVFFKEKGSTDNFICKVYPEHEKEANLIESIPRLLKALEEIASGEGIYGMQAGEYKKIAQEALKKSGRIS